MRTGRPRIHPAGVSDSGRAALSRAAMLATGGRKLDVMLDSETNQALQAIQAATGETKTAAVTRLIQAEAKKLRRKS